MEEMLESSVSGGINFTGLGSGTDFNQMIEQLIKIEQRRVARLELWKSEWDEKTEAFQELNSSMVSLRSSLADMNTVDKFFQKSTASSNEAVLTATSNSDAEEGTYEIEVNALAQNHIMFSNQGFASRNDAVNPDGGNTFSYTYAGKEVTVDIPDNTSLTNFANILNNDPNNPGIRASIVNQGDDYYLQLRGMDQGVDNTITINGTTSITAFYDAEAEFTTSQDAQNSRIKVDGWPTGTDWIERDTNSISDVIDGLTFNLYSTGTARITVENDNQAIKEQVYSFIDQVNEVLTMINEHTNVDGSGQGSLLTGNYGLQMVKSRLKNIMSTIGIGFDRQVGGDKFPSLSTIGITTDAERGSPTFGLLKIDEEILDHALKNDPQGVAELISGDLEPDTNSADFRFGSLVKGVTRPGIFNVEYEVDGAGKILWATIDGKTAGIEDNYITAREGDPRGLSIQVDNLNAGTYDGNVRLKSGKVNEISDALKELTDSSDGTLNILKDNYKDIIRNIDDKIEYEERRIARMEKDLRMKFARLEELLGYYDGLQKSMSSQIAQLTDD